MSTDTLAIRAEIEQEIAGLTLPVALARTVEAEGDRAAYSDKVGIDLSAGYAPGWRTLTWNELRERALDVAGALLAAGVEAGDRVALMASNRIEHVVADLGVVHAAGISMSVYNTLSPDQIAYVAGHAEPSVVVLESADHLARWERALAESTSIRRVVVIDVAAPDGDDRFVAWDAFLAAGSAWRADHAAQLTERTAAISPDDPLTILYTSGTTGNPKGVVLTHHAVLYECLCSLRVAAPTQHNEFISYLPFAHIAERTLGMYIPQVMGAHIHLVADPALLLGALGEVHPTRFFGVPRVWEKIKTGISAKLAAETDPEKKAQVEAALAVGLEYVEAQQTGRSVPPELEARFRAADAGLLAFLRALLGLDRCEWAASAAAPMPLEVARFFAGLGMRIYDVYGMTETCAAVTACGPDQFRLGTVGKSLPGIEIKLGEDNEILARGPVASKGYYKQDDATAALIDADGWVHTGDIGEIDEDGFLKVVDRKKEMIITSSGKNIAPSNIENYLKESPIVGHALVFGEGRPYVVAVLTLDAEIAPLVAAQVGIPAGTSLAELAQHPAMLAIAQQAVDAANERLSRPEQVKAWELLPVEWTAESEELTPTLKLKRRVVHAKYADVLERLYS
ncbi:AMP-dependent synthetase/ligase [Nocardioides daeguensis]|uniref:Acyl-CoA synthetase n=1 Tax=Nocardioides daeguensis TaxID=908359 RepID=A0ABP6WIJ3_9ACTN|nr:AMP-dependent synthetase/ligase [Nocardioides daeguensis]MBV6729045.1 long-chain fatty acid--CoA ligase [Nocardioides daeguensis]MCR1774951.1 long-chain fatty acid--CoA ligase [Nocardioides daeguensis]